MNTEKVWYVTGASKGLGLSLVKKLLAEGYKVAATSRSKEALVHAVGINDETRFLALAVNLADQSSIAKSIKETLEKFGKLDVVVNNAGYGIGGTVEELNNQEIHDSFDVNVFATISVVQEAIPFMRAQRSGHIINISSIAGFAPAIGWGMYAATKYALMGLSEVLAEDVKEFGIKVTVVAPGAFRTQFLSQESLALSERKIADYKGVQDSHAKYLSMAGTQLGDPEKAADVFIALAANPNPPVRLFLGSDAYNRAKAKMELLTNEIEQWKELSFSTNFEG